MQSGRVGDIVPQVGKQLLSPKSSGATFPFFGDISPVPRARRPSPAAHRPQTIPKPRTPHPPSLLPSSAMSYQTKILRTANAPLTPPSEIEQQIAQALLDLENNVPDLKSELRQLQISAAKEVDVKGGKKAVVVFVPVPMVKAFHTIQQR